MKAMKEISTTIIILLALCTPRARAGVVGWLFNSESSHQTDDTYTLEASQRSKTPLLCAEKIRQRSPYTSASYDTGAVVALYKQQAGNLISATSTIETDICLEAAAAALPPRCDGLTREQQTHIAMALTNCHLERSGRPAYPCSLDEPAASCTKRMRKDDSAFSTYTAFFIQTQNVCKQLRDELLILASGETMEAMIVAADANSHAINSLAERTDRLTSDLNTGFKHLGDSADDLKIAIVETTDTVLARSKDQLEIAQRGIDSLNKISGDTSALVDTSAQIRKNVEDVCEKQVAQLASLAEIKITTDSSLENLEEIEDGYKTVFGIVSQITVSADQAAKAQTEMLVAQHQFAITQERMEDRMEKLASMLDRILWVLTLVFGEVLDISSMMWYIGAAIFCIFATWSYRTSNARVWLIVGWIFTLVLERCIVTAVVGMGTTPEILSQTRRYMGWLRYLFFAYAVAILIRSIVTYKDCMQTVYRKIDESCELMGVLKLSETLW